MRDRDQHALHPFQTHGALAEAKWGLLQFPAFWGPGLAMHSASLQLHPSKAKKKCHCRLEIGRETKAFGNTWLNLDKVRAGVTRFGARAFVFSFQNHLEKLSRICSYFSYSRPKKAMWDFQEPSPS